MRTFAVQGTGEDHAFAKVRLDDGGTAIIDLGPVRDLQDQNVRFRGNQRLTVEGHPGRVNDQPVIVAYTLETANQRYDLSQIRDETRQQAQAGSQGQRDQRDQRSQRGERQQQARADEQRQREQTVSGQLVGYRTFNLRNERDPHVLGKVRTHDDELVVIDLGPARDLRRQQAQLERGMQVTGRGAAGRINDRPVLVLSLVELDGDRYNMSDRQRKQGARQQSGARQSDQGRDERRSADRQRGGGQQTAVLVMGNLKDTRDVSLKGVPDEHRLVKLDTFHGGQVVVDLGTKENVQSLKLQRGDTVVIQGQPARINDRPVVRADQVAEIASITRTR